MRLRMFLASLVLVGCSPHLAWCDEGGPPREVEFWAALEQGELQAAVMPHTFSVMTLRVQNQAPEALRVRLPDALAAMPTARLFAQEQLRQRGLSPSLANSYPPKQGSYQSLGFSLAGPWAEQQGGAPDPAVGRQGQPEPRRWVLAPREWVQLQVPCFCLEYGRPGPNRSIPYQLVPLETVNSQPVMAELLTRFGHGAVDQRVAQLAAWHVADGVPWPMLARAKLPQSFNRAAGAVTREELRTAQQFCLTLVSSHEATSLGGTSLHEPSP